MDRYSFIVMDSHHLLFAGLPALPIPAVRVSTIVRLKSTEAVEKRVIATWAARWVFGGDGRDAR